MVYDAVVEVLGYKMLKLPELFLLGLKMEEIKPQDRAIVWYMMTAARIIYVKHWETQCTPELYEWKAKVMSMAEMDK